MELGQRVELLRVQVAKARKAPLLQKAAAAEAAVADAVELIAVLVERLERLEKWGR